MRRKRKNRKKWMVWGAGAGLFLLWGFWVIQREATRIPVIARSNSRAYAAYLAADRLRDHPALDYVPCYCGCGRLGHRSIRSCFLRGRKGYDDHGAYCNICVDIMLRVEDGVDKGLSVSEIRRRVDAKYASDPRFRPTPTPTPQPPPGL